MFTRQVFYTILSLSLFLSFCSSETAEPVATDTESTIVQVQEEDDLLELQNQIRREKFDLILPQVMREHNIDMWIHVMRVAIPDLLALDFGSNSGVFIFTDRGENRIERAVLGRRLRGSHLVDRMEQAALGRRWIGSDLVEECGAYDIIGEATLQRELPGGPETEYDHRFKDVGEFVVERDPKRIAVNYNDELGPPVGPDSRYNDGISNTDYNLLVKALGDKYAERIVSSEYLMIDYLSRRVKSEIVLFTKIGKTIAENMEREFDNIVPGVTKFSDFKGQFLGGRFVVDPDRIRYTDDYVLQRGDLFLLVHGLQQRYMNYDWKFGNFYETVLEYGYVLREGETELPPEIKKAWADAMKIRKVLEDNIKVGRTGGETYEVLKDKLEEAGFINNDRQLYYKDLDREKTQVALDLHALGKGVLAPRIGPLGPDWQRDMTLPPIHHFVFEYFTYTPMPEWGSGKHQSKYLSFWFHDGAIVTERGVEYIYPAQKEIRLIR